MKKFLILALCATVAITPAFAKAGVNYTTPSVELSNQQADLSFAFDDVKNLQVVVMTDKEMMETEGAALPYIAGAGIGAWGYMGGAAGSGNFSWIGFGATVAGGAAVGAITGPVAISRYYTAARVAGASGFLTSRMNK